MEFTNSLQLVGTAEKVGSWLEYQVPAVSEYICEDERSRKTRPHSSEPSLRIKSLYSRILAINKKLDPLLKRDVQLAKKSRQLREKAQKLLSSPTVSTPAKPVLGVRAKMLQSKIARVQMQVSILKRKDEDLKGETKQLQMKAKELFIDGRVSAGDHSYEVEASLKSERQGPASKRQRLTRRLLRRSPREDPTQYTDPIYV